VAPSLFLELQTVSNKQKQTNMKHVSLKRNNMTAIWWPPVTLTYGFLPNSHVVGELGMQTAPAVLSDLHLECQKRTAGRQNYLNGSGTTSYLDSDS
jgi:hypothetical protein